MLDMIRRDNDHEELDQSQVDDAHAGGGEHGSDRCGNEDQRRENKGKQGGGRVQRDGEGRSSGNRWIDAPTTSAFWTMMLGARARLNGARIRS